MTYPNIKYILKAINLVKKYAYCYYNIQSPIQLPVAIYSSGVILNISLTELSHIYNHCFQAHTSI